MLALLLPMAGCLAPVGAGVDDEDDARVPVVEPDASPETDAGAGLPAEDAGRGNEDPPDPVTDAAVDSEVDAADSGPGSAPLMPSCDFRAEMRHCGACHSAGLLVAGLDLLSEDVAERVVDVKARSDCGSGKLVDLSDPAQSVLYLRISGDACGVSTVHQRDMALQTCVLSWIESL